MKNTGKISIIKKSLNDKILKREAVKRAVDQMYIGDKVPDDYTLAVKVGMVNEGKERTGCQAVIETVTLPTPRKIKICTNLEQIDSSTPEGRLALSLLAYVTTTTMTDKTPDEVIEAVNAVHAVVVQEVAE